jgi:NAD(P)-dependent dehydrogenase (short-subunit alcohol dehydrogenase family)
MRRRVFVTGSTTGLGRAAAQSLLENGHEVVVHARSAARAADLDDLADRASGVVIGDLANASGVLSVADQANSYGAFDAVIHNAGIYVDRERFATEEGHARVLAVNVLAPYMLTALIERPARLIYLSSGMHREGDSSLRDIEWTSRRWHGVQAYCDSKLFVTALAAATARRWSNVLRARHPGVARRHRRPRGERHRKVLVPPGDAGASACCQRSGVPGSPARRAQPTQRRRASLMVKSCGRQEGTRECERRTLNKRGTSR